MGRLLLVFLALPPADAIVTAPPLPADPPGHLSVEETVLRRITQQPVGSQTLDALRMPDGFLRRVGDRIIRMSYQQRFRSVGAGAAPAVSPRSDLDRRSPESGAAARWSEGLYLAGWCLTAVAVAALLLLRRRRRVRS